MDEGGNKGNHNPEKEKRVRGGGRKLRKSLETRVGGEGVWGGRFQTGKPCKLKISKKAQEKITRLRRYQSINQPIKIKDIWKINKKPSGREEKQFCRNHQKLVNS